MMGQVRQFKAKVQVGAHHDPNDPVSNAQRAVAARIIVDDHGCWIWQLQIGRGGYGAYYTGTFRKKRAHRAHRYAYEAFVGPIPKGMELDHLCRVRKCVNPSHLEPVTHRENVQRGTCAQAARDRAQHRDECRYGHPYVTENLYVQPNGRRRCRECHRAGTRRSYHRRKGNLS